MKFNIFIIGFLFCSLFGYSQTTELKHIEGNSYLIRTYSLNINKIEALLKKKHNELEKNRSGLVNTIVLNFENDTLTIIGTDSTGIMYRMFYNSGKRGAAENRRIIKTY